MASSLTKATLSLARRRLLELMQDMHFGRIEGLDVHGGEPVRDPPPRVIREHKFGGDNGPRPERGASDFLLKAQVVEPFQFLDGMGDGSIALVEVKHGLPFKLEVVGPPA